MASKLDPNLLAPPKSVQNACEQGIELHGEHGGKGLRETTVQWARHFAAGKPNDPAQARRMRAWFHRHRVDKRDGWDAPPTPGYVAWLLWGGDEGVGWVEQIVAAVEASGEGDEKPSSEAAGRNPSQLAKAVTRRSKAKRQTRGVHGTKKAISKKKGSKKAAAGKAKKKASAAGKRTKKASSAAMKGRKKAAGRKKTARTAKAAGGKKKASGRRSKR